MSTEATWWFALGFDLEATTIMILCFALSKDEASKKARSRCNGKPFEVFRFGENPEIMRNWFISEGMSLEDANEHVSLIGCEILKLTK